jgi:hypothetical protein
LIDGKYMTTGKALHLVELIVAIGTVIASLEMLVVHRIFQDEGLLSWRLHRLTLTNTALLIRRSGLEHVFKYPQVLALVGLRAAVGMSVVLSVFTKSSTTVPITLLSVLTLLLTLRSPAGNDGSDQMASVVLASSALGELVGTDFAKSATLLFIAAESALAYATAGFLKVPLGGWRDGTFVLDVLRTASFGNKRVLKLFEDLPLLAVVFGLGVVLGDSAIAFASVLPPYLSAILLVYGVALHIGIALILGLNNFVWSFVAAYPAILWVSTCLYGRMF